MCSALLTEHTSDAEQWRSVKRRHIVRQELNPWSAGCSKKIRYIFLHNTRLTGLRVCMISLCIAEKCKCTCGVWLLIRLLQIKITLMCHNNVKLLKLYREGVFFWIHYKNSEASNKLALTSFNMHVLRTFLILTCAFKTIYCPQKPGIK